jgi:hypothetical protein
MTGPCAVTGPFVVTGSFVMTRRAEAFAMDVMHRCIISMANASALPIGGHARIGVTPASGVTPALGSRPHWGHARVGGHARIGGTPAPTRFRRPFIVTTAMAAMATMARFLPLCGPLDQLRYGCGLGNQRGMARLDLDCFAANALGEPALCLWLQDLIVA